MDESNPPDKDNANGTSALVLIFIESDNLSNISSLMLLVLFLLEIFFLKSYHFINFYILI